MANEEGILCHCSSGHLANDGPASLSMGRGLRYCVLRGRVQGTHRKLREFVGPSVSGTEEGEQQTSLKEMVIMACHQSCCPVFLSRTLMGVSDIPFARFCASKFLKRISGDLDILSSQPRHAHARARGGLRSAAQGGQRSAKDEGKPRSTADPDDSWPLEARGYSRVAHEEFGLREPPEKCPAEGTSGSGQESPRMVEFRPHRFRDGWGT